MATTWPSSSSALYTVPKPPSPIWSDGEKLRVALATCCKLRWTDPNLLSFGDWENLEGLGGTRSGLGGTFSEAEFTLKGDIESAARP